jgi:cell division protein FtsB
VNTKVKEFLYEVVSNTVSVMEHCRRVEAVPYDLAHALRLFAGDNPNLLASVPKFVMPDYSSSDDPDDEDEGWWRVVPDQEDEQVEDMNVTDSMLDIDSSSYLSFDDDDDVYIDKVDEGKYQEDNPINIFHATYPPVFIEELTDKQFREEVLVPLISAHCRLYMGFDIKEEDYEEEEPKDGKWWSPLCRDAPMMIGMMKRAMYAFVVASIRKDFECKSIQKLQSQVTSKDEALKEMAAKEVAMQAKIDSLQEQLKKFTPETVDSTNDTQLPQSQSGGGKAAEEERSPKRLRPEGGRSTVEGPRTRSSIRQVQVKQENIKEGAIKCPDPECGNIILLSKKGCNLVVCTKHKPHFLYFCAHCKIRPEPFSESLGCDCPKRNTPQDRVMAQEMRNKRARVNPEVLE